MPACCGRQAPVHGGEFVLAEIAAVLGVEEPERGRTLAEAIAGYLRTGRFLVVLDNCEHVTSAAGAAAAALLHRAPGLAILATSREPLSLPGEVTWTVPELSGPDALALFVERARQASPDLVLDSGQLAVIHGICQQLDGLPLAIELAAARARVLSPARIASALGQRFDLLSRTAQPGPARQGTLRASFEWSYDLLSAREGAPGPARGLRRRVRARRRPGRLPGCDRRCPRRARRPEPAGPAQRAGQRASVPDAGGHQGICGRAPGRLRRGGGNPAAALRALPGAGRGGRA